MQIWKRAKADTQTKIGWRTIVHKTFVDPTGTPHTFDIVGQQGSAVGLVIALTPEYEVIVAEQFRPGPEKVFQELPGGFCEAGEEPQAAALRELHEETGYVSNDVLYLGSVYKDAYTNTMWHYVLARNCTIDGAAHTDAGEFIVVNKISIAQLFENARTGRMSDSEGVFLAYELLKEMEKKYVQTN